MQAGRIILTNNVRRLWRRKRHFNIADTYCLNYIYLLPQRFEALYLIIT